MPDVWPQHGGTLSHSMLLDHPQYPRFATRRIVRPDPRVSLVGAIGDGTVNNDLAAVG